MNRDYQVVQNPRQEQRDRWPYVVTYDGMVIGCFPSRDSAERNANRLRLTSYIPTVKDLAKLRREKARTR